LSFSADKAGGTAKGAVEVVLNGKVAGRLALTSENNDLLHQFVFKAADLQNRNAIAIRFDGKGALAYQVVGSYFLP
jgi:hypothetical protein